MSERTDQAIAKITNEMMQLKDPIAQGVEEHLTEICTNDNYIFGKIINGKEAGFEFNGNIFEMPEWDINVIKTHGYARMYVGDAII